VTAGRFVTSSILGRTEDHLARIGRYNADLRAFISIRGEAARREAAELDARLQNGDSIGLPAGCVIALKDNIDIAGEGTTLGSGFHSDRVPNTDSEVVKRLRRAGAVVVGKTNLHELAFGATTQDPHFGSCRNPWNTQRIAGGSSGGSAAAVAASMCEVALGTDTGGSIRVPSALTGIAGLRPTVGRVSSRGVEPVSPDLDTVGPMARTVAAVASVYEAIAGYDPEDELSVDRPVESWLGAAARGVDGLRIGVARVGEFKDVDPAIETAVRKAKIVLAGLGATVCDIDLRDPDSLHARLKLLVPTNIAARNRKRLKEHPETFGPDVRERMSLGLSTTGADYADWLRLIEGWRMWVRRQFESIDIIVTPTVPWAAPLAAESANMIATTAGLTRQTFIWSYLQLPALSVPCGFTASNLPIGMQLIGPQWSEARLLAAGAAYQDVTDFHRRRPPAYA
jgi:aspartyl-tRNA(Asn)/glutamyl-tRNA(Gln) amidotransferase subunit A